MTITHNWFTGKTTLSMTPEELTAVRDAERARVMAAVKSIVAAAKLVNKNMRRVIEIGG